MSSEPKMLRRLARIGITNFEQTQRHQADMLRRVQRAEIDPGHYAGLADCGPKSCGRAECTTEACYFGARRRQLKETPKAHRLLAKAPGSLHELRIIRYCWA